MVMFPFFGIGKQHPTAGNNDDTSIDGSPERLPERIILVASFAYESSARCYVIIKRSRQIRAERRRE